MKNYIKYLCALLLLGLSTSTWAADETLTLAQGSITASYTTNTSSQNTSASNAIGLSWTRCLYSAGFQLEANNGEIHSTSYPSTNCVIKTITLTVSTGTAALMGSYNGTSWYPVSFTSGSAVNVENMGFRFFKITNTGSMCKFSALSVVYTIPTYYTITYNDKDGEHTVSALKGRTLTEVLSEVYSGADPTSCNTTDYPYFYGWKSSAISGTTSTPPTVLKAEKVTAAATYYAVWTDEPLEWAAASSISEGDKVVFCYVNGDTKKEMTSLYGDYFAVSNFETGESVPTGTYTFLVETGNGGTGFSFLHDGGYISHVGDKKVTLSPIKNNASSWTVSFSGTNATMTNADATSYKFQYNTGSPRFTDYSSSQSLPQIYKKQQSGTPVYLTSCCDNMVDAPTVTGTSTKNSIILSWTNVTDATGYIVACSGGTPGSVNSSGTSRSCTITGLSPNTTYTWSVVATYEDPYCGATPANGNTTTSQVYAVTYDANGGTVTTLPSAASYAVGETVTVAAKPATTVKDGYNFTGWNTSDDGTGDHYESSGSATFIMPSSAVTLYAEWTAKTYEKYVFSCVDISVASADAGKALVTSRNGINVMATNPIKVTVSGAVAGHRVTFTNSVGLKFYKKVEGTGSDAGKYKYVEAIDANSFVTPLTNQEVYVSYNPTSDGTGAVLSALPFTISCDGESQEFNTSGEYVKARNLPDAVVIAAKNANTWKALPANIGTSFTYPTPVMVSVSPVSSVPTAFGPSTLAYKLWPVKTTSGTADRFGTHQFSNILYGDRLRFAGNSNHGLGADNSATTHKLENDATITDINNGGTDPYEWKITTTEVDGQFVYTFQSDQSTNKNFLRLWGSKWGTYTSGNDQLYLLPLSVVTPAEITVMEWGTNQIAVSYPNRASCTAMTAKIGDGDASTVTIASLGGDLYRLTGVGNLEGNAAKQLTLTATEGSDKQALFVIPYIISSGTGTPTSMRTATGDNTSNAITRGVEVVVRSGAKFEVDATTKLMTSDIYIYPGGAFEIASGRELSVSGLYLRGGYSWLGGSFAMPHAKINASVDGLATGNGLNYDYYIDATQYYDLAVPKTMTWNPVTDDKGSDAVDLWVKQYNGATRASTGKGWEWYDWTADPLNINMGQGYLVAATPKYGRPYLIMRFPLNMTLPDDETTKALIPVTAYGVTGGELNPGVSANNAGWNLIANPFLTSYKKDADGVDEEGEAITGSIAIGELVPEEVDDKPTGKYEWDADGAKNVRYVTTFDYSTQTYAQHKMSETTLEPFTGFFIQVAKDCYVKFDASGRQNNIIARRLKESLPDDMEVGITASIGEESDEAIILLCDELSRDNALEFPDESSKMINAGHLNFYTFAGATTMYANGMSYAEGQEWNAAGITPTVSGEYTFSATRVNTNYVKEVLLKDLYNNAEYDLLSSDVSIYLDEGTTDDRFAIKVVLKSESDTPTALDELNNDGINRGPEKFIYKDKMYIRNNGVLYDATGRKVREINK